MKGSDKKAKEQQEAEKEAVLTEEDVKESEKNPSSENAEGNKEQGDAAQKEEAEKTPQELIVELQKENTELKDQYLRKLADFDNYRKRMIREKQDAIDFANTNLLKDLVSTLDDFDRALNSTPKAAGEEVNPVVQGIEMINKQMHSMLEVKYNLAAFGDKGDIFDPDKHEAIATNQAPVSEPCCAEVYVKGYMLKDRVIRPAKVMVHMPDGTASAE